MNQDLVASGRGLPMAALLAATAVVTLLLLLALAKSKSRAGRFVVFAVWARFLLSAYHSVTYQKLVAGLSGNALGSIAVLGLGLAVINKRLLLQAPLFSFYLLIGVIGLSGLVNGAYAGLVTSATKIGYLLVITVGLYEALARVGERRTLGPMLWAFSPLLVCQMLSVALGVVKATESDGSASYIGGYNHEAAFSVGLAGALLTACFAAGARPLWRNGLILASLAGLYLANYRTSILAVAPLVFAYFALPELRRLYVEHQRLIRFGAVILSLLVATFAAIALQERFRDLSATLASVESLVQPPEDYDAQQRRLLSGRPYIWSVFIDGHLGGTGVQRLLGFGPESWVGFHTTYPHNTLVAHLFEFGWIGVAATVFLWASMLYYACKAEGPVRSRLIAAHLSFALLNMATMPHWMIEGNIFYGILCGLTLYNYRLAQAQRSRRGAVGLALSAARAGGAAEPARR